MQIEVKDLQVGDEILFSSNSSLIYAKVLKPISLKNMSNSRWRLTNKTYCKSVKCSYRVESKDYSYTSPSGTSKIYTGNFYIASPDEHNMEKHFDLNHKTIWLIKR